MARIPVNKKRFDVSGTCPFCGSDAISETGLHLLIDQLEVDCFCARCLSKFKEIYNVDYAHTEWLEPLGDDEHAWEPEVKDPMVNSEED